MKKRSDIKKTPIGIFRHTLLPLSETFIAEQAAHISNFEVHFFGRERGTGDFKLPNCHLIQDHSESRFPERAWYTLTGRSGRLLREMESVAPVLLHAHFGVEGVYALPFAQRMRIPLVVTFHGFDATRDIKGLLRSGKISHLRYAAGIERLKREGSLFIAVSEYIRSRLLERGFPADRVVVHHIGIDPERFTPQTDNDDDRTVLTVARLVEKKGTEYLIRAVARIKSNVPDVRLEIVGDGPLRSSLEQLAERLGLSEQVVFHGALSYDGVAEAMGRASVFCLPSVIARDGDTEGMGIVLLEAAASGKPVVGTLHAGIPEAVRDGETGFLVPERDDGALADQLLRLLNNRQLRCEMGKAGRTQIEQDFDIRKQTQKLERLYLDVIGREF